MTTKTAREGLSTREQAEEWRIKKYMSQLYFLEVREAPLSTSEMVTTIATDEYKQMLMTIRALCDDIDDKQFDNYDMAVKSFNADIAIITKELDELKAKLEKAEKVVDAFYLDNDIVSVPRLEVLKQALAAYKEGEL